MRFLHVADLHISQTDKAYSLGVWKEIIDHARRLEVDALLLCGDIFDSLSDLEVLRREFCDALGSYEGQTLYIPGNHEGGHKNQSISSFDLSPCRVLTQLPYEVIDMESCEIVGIPHRNTYHDFVDWPPMPKPRRPRIVMAHGQWLDLAPMADEEEGGSLIDPLLFDSFEATYIALGHIHRRPPSIKRNQTLIQYSGSTRVWRKGEFGPRKIVYGEIKDGALRCEDIVLESAGQYRIWELLADNSLKDNLALLSLPTEITSHDFLEIYLTGTMESELELKHLESQIQKHFESKVRKLKVDTTRLNIFSGLSHEPLVKDFMLEWNKEISKAQSPEVKSKLLYVRDLVLSKIRKEIERRNEVRP